MTFNNRSNYKTEKFKFVFHVFGSEIQLQCITSLANLLNVLSSETTDVCECFDEKLSVGRVLQYLNVLCWRS